jgi:aspartate kinase
VEFARNHGVTLHVRSTFSEADGTWVREEDERMLEKAIISGVTHTIEEAVYEVRAVAPADIFDALAAAGVSVDTFMQVGGQLVFSVPLEDRADVEAALGRMAAHWTEHSDLGKVSVVGAGMRSHPGIAAQAFGVLRELAIEPRFVSSSPIKIGFFVPKEEVERVVAAMHEAFELASVGAQRSHG